MRRPLVLLAMASVLGCVEQAEEKPTAEDMEIVKKNLLSAPPTLQAPANANLDDKVVYLGVEASPNPAEAGKDLRLTHYWQVKAPPGEGWRTFTHVQGSARMPHMNVDHGPVRGKYPVAQWKAGDIIRDEHSFRVPANWENVLVYTGLWRGAERMAIKAGPHDEATRVLGATIPVKGAVGAAPPKRYLVHKTPKPLKIDGKLDEPAWATAPALGAFVDTLSGAAAAIKTDGKLLWDDKNLYIAFENVDTDVASTLTKRDDKLWAQDAVEVMIDANGDKKSYVELQVAPTNAVFDTYLPEFRKYEDALDPKRKMYDWNSKVKTAVKVDGTLNKREDQDKGWTVELALPLADANGLLKEGVKVPPALGDTWRMNFFRLESPKGSKDQLAAAWSPPLTGDFHALDRFGQIVFTDDKGLLPVSNVGNSPHGAPPSKESVRATHKAIMEGIQPPTGTTPPGGLKIEGAKSAAAARAKKAGEDKKK
jgi:hypothetical protein